MVKGLQLPFILSYRNLKQMKGVIDTELDEVTFKTLKGPLIVKMGQLPGKEYEVETNKRLTVGPNQEMVTKVELKSSVNIINKNLR